MEIHIKKSRFSEKSQFMESKCADGGHSLNRDFTAVGSKNLWKWSGDNFTESNPLYESEDFSLVVITEE